MLIPEISIPITFTVSAMTNVLASLWSERTCNALDAFKEIQNSKNTDSQKILYVSLGTAEVTVLLASQYAEQMFSHSKLPRICRIEVARMSDATIDGLLRQKLLPKEFKARLHSNLSRLKSVCTEHGVSYKEFFWPKLPIFHGFIYDNTAYIGRWAVGDNGLLSHNSQLHRFTGKKHTTRIKDFLSAGFPTTQTSSNV